MALSSCVIGAKVSPAYVQARQQAITRGDELEPRHRCDNHGPCEIQAIMLEHEDERTLRTLS